jgi:hypothetical protein
MILFGGNAAEARARKVIQNKEKLPVRRSQTGEGGSPHSHVTPCVTKNNFSGFSGHSTKRPVPVLLVEYANPWSILAKSDFSSNWRPTYNLIRTHYINNAG